MGSIAFMGERVTLPSCKKCGEDLRFEGFGALFRYAAGDKVKARCRSCDKHYFVQRPTTSN